MKEKWTMKLMNPPGTVLVCSVSLLVAAGYGGTEGGNGSPDAVGITS